MINMKKYAGGKKPYELFSEAVDRKDKNSADTIALNVNKRKVEIAYRYYERAMDNQKLGLLTPSTVLSSIKQPLLGMYSSGCKLVKDFRTWHFNNNPQTYNNVCPYCTINSANTTEHILPKEVYSVIHLRGKIYSMRMVKSSLLIFILTLCLIYDIYSLV